jgi:hypothetical protein
MSYDPDRAALLIGNGEFSPVSPEAWEYAVGGRNVIRSWFNYRKRDPGGKKTSPLDRISPASWEPDWTTEVIDVLTSLTRLTALEPAQTSLLERILAAPTLTAADLAAAGARWPGSSKDRKPRYSSQSLRPTEPSDGQAILDI